MALPLTFYEVPLVQPLPAPVQQPPALPDAQAGGGARHMAVGGGGASHQLVHRPHQNTNLRAARGFVSIYGENSPFWDPNAPNGRKVIPSDNPNQCICLPMALRGICYDNCGGKLDELSNNEVWCVAMVGNLMVEGLWWCGHPGAADLHQQPVWPPKPKGVYTMSMQWLNGTPLLTEVAKGEEIVTTRSDTRTGTSEDMRSRLAASGKDAKECDTTATNYHEQCKARVWNDELGKLITCHSKLLLDLGWEGFMWAVHQRGDLWPDPNVVGEHPVYHLLHHLAKHRALAVTATKPWMENQWQQRLRQGPHKSCGEHTRFLCEEMVKFGQQGYWTTVPYQLKKSHTSTQGHQ